MSTSLFQACQGGDTKLVSTLLEQNVDLQSHHLFGYTPLMAASNHNHDAIVQMLLQRGAFVDAQSDFGRTALSFASTNVDSKVVILLLQHGGNVNLSLDDNQTPLRHALKNENVRTVMLLLEAGAIFDKSIFNHFAKWGSLWGVASHVRDALLRSLIRECPNLSLFDVNDIIERTSECTNTCKLLSQACGRRPVVSLHSKLRLY